MQKKGLKYRTRYELHVNVIFTDGVLDLHEEAKLTNSSTNELEILQVNKFSSWLVHRHIIISLTPLLLALLIMISPDNTLECRQQLCMSIQVNYGELLVFHLECISSSLTL